MKSFALCVSLLRLLSVYLLVVHVIIGTAQDLVGFQTPRSLVAEFPEAKDQLFDMLMANLGLRAGVAVLAALLYFGARPCAARMSHGLDVAPTPSDSAA
ncbi:MAG: hypothetical protein IT434_09540 [Phycisphaerales bacterium]|jgi:hypothetical protein|nr:hypothetical protein [Phycisphaerales bacterium]